MHVYLALFITLSTRKFHESVLCKTLAVNKVTDSLIQHIAHKRSYFMPIRSLILILLLFIQPSGVWAIDVDEIVTRANHAAYYQGQDGKAKVQMVISDKQGRKRTRDFTILRYDAAGARVTCNRRRDSRV